MKKMLFPITNTPFSIDFRTSGKEAGLYVNGRLAVKSVQYVLLTSEIFIGFVQNRLIPDKEYQVEEIILSFGKDVEGKVSHLNVNILGKTYKFDKLECNYIASCIKKALAEVKFSKYMEYVDVFEDDESEIASYSYFR